MKLHTIKPQFGILSDLESIQSKITWLNKKIATNKERRETVRKDIVNTEQQLRGQIRKINGKLALQKESIDKYVKCKKQNCEGEIGYQLMQDFLDIIQREERNFNVTIGNLSTVKKCFKERQQAYQQMMQNNSDEECYSMHPRNSQPGI
ncbi:unnamed protein product [Heterobilharzia americana]|nr:unnamed protein product [Heterobilharzia americana]